VATSTDRSDPEIAPQSRLVIVRHGEAYCNTESYIGGHTSCKGLTDRGRAQVAVLAERLARTGELDGAVGLYTSMLRRAIESAEILAPALGGEFVRDDDLCERHPGEADGLSWEAYEQVYGRVSLPGDDPDLALSPGGESWIDFLDRAAAGLQRRVSEHPGGLVVVVSHGGVIDASIIRFLGIGAHGTQIRLHPEHASMTEWAHTGARWRLVRYNDAAHLVGPEMADLQTIPPPWVRVDPALAVLEAGAHVDAEQA
jgi:2,3-bisphosphoglycerate-dependent phosphoglycerate mutase